MATKSLCTVDGCDKRIYARGWCSLHHRQFGAPRGATQKFILEAIESDTDDCIEWPFARSRIGHGKVKINGKDHYVHRLVCSRTLGEQPEKLACHTCGNPPCINPRHLYWGTVHTNHADFLRHTNHPNAFLMRRGVGRKRGVIYSMKRVSDEQAREIALAFEDFREDLSRRLDVLPQEVNAVLFQGPRRLLLAPKLDDLPGNHNSEAADELHDERIGNRSKKRA